MLFDLLALEDDLFDKLKYLLCESIQEYSKIAMMMKSRQAMIHCIRALVLPPDWGEVLATEFRVLIMHRKRVRSSPSLPGIASFGTRKLI